MGKWKLNGIELGDANTRVEVTSLNNTGTVRQGYQEIHGGSEYREKLGLKLARAKINFIIQGRDQDALHAQVETITDTLDSDEVWTLETPQGRGVSIYKNNTRAALSTDGNWQVEVRGANKISLSINAVINGVWIADGGEFCETLTGNFELQSTGPSVYIRDDGTNTGATPILRVPAQTSGYPLAVRESDFAMAQPTLTDTIVVGGLVYEEYDMTGFLVPEPTSAGDFGLYEVCSSPSANFLGNDFPSSDLDSFDFGELTAAAMLVVHAATNMDSLDFGELGATGSVTANAASNMDTFNTQAISATALLLVALTRENGDELTTETGSTLIAET